MRGRAEPKNHNPTMYIYRAISPKLCIFHNGCMLFHKIVYYMTTQTVALTLLQLSTVSIYYRSARLSSCPNQ